MRMCSKRMHQSEHYNWMSSSSQIQAAKAKANRLFILCHSFPLFSCFLQYCSFLWKNCQYICPAAGGWGPHFFHDRKYSFCCRVGKLGCMLTWGSPCHRLMHSPHIKFDSQWILLVLTCIVCILMHRKLWGKNDLASFPGSTQLLITCSTVNNWKVGGAWAWKWDKECCGHKTSSSPCMIGC